MLRGVHTDPANLVVKSTVSLLQLNHSNRFRERETLAETGRYPTIGALPRMKE